jgi:carboxyl-terminal processing protease
VASEQYRDRPQRTYSVEKPGALSDIPLVVLVNANTASAAEILAGALQARGRAQLVGAPTYGKNTIQLVFDLSDGSSVHVTAAHWSLPGKTVPLQPDVPKEDDGSGALALAAAKRLLGD